MDYNSMTFMKEDIDNGLHLKLIDFLINLRGKTWDSLDIRVQSNAYCVTVDWCDKQSNDNFSGFQYLEEDDVIMREVRFPDGHYEYLLKEDINAALDAWKQSNPQWHMTSYGTWTNDEENEKLRKYLMREAEQATQDCEKATEMQEGEKDGM